MANANWASDDERHSNDRYAFWTFYYLLVNTKKTCDYVDRLAIWAERALVDDASDR